MESGKKPAFKATAEKPKDVEVHAEDAGEANGTANGDKKPEVKADDTEQKPVKAAELRTAYEGLKKKIKEEYEPKARRVTELEAKIKEIESRGDDKAAQERFAAIEKRNTELENHIRFADYKQSKEYKELETTLNDTWAGAMRKLTGISISRTNAETGDVVERELTMDDIARYARLDPKLLWKELKQEIPDAAERTTVINHVQKIQDVSDSVFKAEEKAKAESETHAKSMAEQRQQSQANRVKLWRETNESLATKYPKWFAKAEDDSEGNTLFDRGTALADLAFNPTDLTPDRVDLLPKAFKEQIASKKPFTPEQLAQLHAIVRNKASNHDRLAHQNKALAARVAELETTVKQYEESGPDRIPAGGERRIPNGDFEEAGAALDALDRKHA